MTWEQGEVHLGTIRKDTSDIFGTNQRPPYQPVVPATMVVDMPRIQRSMFMDHASACIYAIVTTNANEEPRSIFRYISIFHSNKKVSIDVHHLR
jgi:hypothetical protein